MIIYHAARWKGAGWNRSIRYGYVAFDENGVLQKMNVTSGSEKIKVPSGEQRAVILPLADLADNAEGYKLTIKSEEEKDIFLTIMAREESSHSDGEAITVKTQIADETMYLVECENAQPLFYRLHLQTGENVIELLVDDKGKKIVIDGIELRE